MAFLFPYSAGNSVHTHFFHNVSEYVSFGQMEGQ